jgi:hypothetical protein
MVFPGRGLDSERGVDSSIGTLGFGEPFTVTETTVCLIEGFGAGDAGEPEGDGVIEP